MMKKLQINSTIFAVTAAIIALLIIQTFQTKQIYDKQSGQFNAEVLTTLERVAVRHEKAEDVRRFFKIANTNFNGHYKDVLKEEFQQLLNAKETITVKDTVIWDGGKRENYLIVQGESIDSLLGLHAQQRLLAKDIRKLEDIYSNAKTATDTSTMSLHLDRKVIKKMFDKAKFVNEMMMQAFRENIFEKDELNLDVAFLDSVIRTEFKDDKLPDNYQFVITNSRGNSIQPITEFENYQTNLDLKSSYSTELFPSNLFNKHLTLHIYFPRKSSILLGEMLMPLLVNLSLVLFILFTLTYLFKTIVTQHKFAELKGEFISNMTHEFRTPISTISLACQAMSDPDMLGEAHEQTQPFVKMISDENARLASLVDGILQSNSIEKGEMRLHKEKILINEVISDIAHKAQFRIQNSGGTIQLEMDHELLYIDADKLHFTNVISNLVDNAIKYSKEIPEIKIVVHKHHEKIKIEVHDKGIGIKKEYLDKIYDQLFRIPTGNIHNVKGFGLGLSYVKGICDLHHWKTYVHSKYREGTTFTIEINK